VELHQKTYVLLNSFNCSWCLWVSLCTQHDYSYNLPPQEAELTVFIFFLDGTTVQYELSTL